MRHPLLHYIYIFAHLNLTTTKVNGVFHCKLFSCSTESRNKVTTLMNEFCLYIYIFILLSKKKCEKKCQNVFVNVVDVC